MRLKKTTTVAARTDLAPSPALSILQKAKPGLKTKIVGCLVADGTDATEVLTLAKSAAKVMTVAPKIGAGTADGKVLKVDFQLAGGPLVLFDTVYVLVSEKGAKMLSTEAAAVSWVHNAFAHLKVIGASASAQALLYAAEVVPDAGVVIGGDSDSYLEAAAQGRLFDREPSVRTVF